jgi:enoyl-CoA hydratase/carnithine racemase
MAVDYLKEGKVAIFTLNRPEALNAVDPQSAEELSRAFKDFKEDEGLLVGIITGAGSKAFSIGADVQTMLPNLKEFSGLGNSEPLNLTSVLNTWKPLIAAINGAALGGGLEIALACDLRIASENAIFGMPEITLGLIPGWGGTQRLPRIIPLVKAAELLLIGKPVSAQEAYRIGLVNKIVPLSELMPAAKGMAETICKRAPMAMRAAKQAMVQGMDVSLEDGLKLERKFINLLVRTQDFDEGCKANIEKRQPVFKGK